MEATPKEISRGITTRANGLDLAPRPQSSNENDAWKEYTQCQYCFKSRADGVKLFRCSACQVAIYCSKDCQKKGWAVHKSKCIINQRAGSEATHLKALRAFTNKHRPTLSEAGLRSLELAVDTTRTEREVLLIWVEPREGATKAELSYRVIDAEVTPIDEFNERQAKEMRQQLKADIEAHRAAGMTGEMFVMLMSAENLTANIIGVGFTDEVAKDYTAGRPWKDWLLKRLNEGILA